MCLSRIMSLIETPELLHDDSPLPVAALSGTWARKNVRPYGGPTFGGSIDLPSFHLLGEKGRVSVERVLMRVHDASGY